MGPMSGLLVVPVILLLMAFFMSPVGQRFIHLVTTTTLLPRHLSAHCPSKSSVQLHLPTCPIPLPRQADEDDEYEPPPATEFKKDN